MDISQYDSRRERKARDFERILFEMQPHEVVGPLFQYFAAILKSAPSQKVEEFFDHFRSGVMTCLESRKNAVYEPDDEGIEAELVAGVVE